MKCLPVSKLAASKGVAVHDWHAEVLAIRSFNRYVLDECHNVTKGTHSRILKKRRVSPLESYHSAAAFEIAEDVKLHMYCSEAPCEYCGCSKLKDKGCADTCGLSQVAMQAWNSSLPNKKILPPGKFQPPQRLRLLNQTQAPSRCSRFFPGEHTSPSSESFVVSPLGVMLSRHSPSLAPTSSRSSSAPLY